MSQAEDLLDQYFLEMRWRTLSLAADFDRVERQTDGAALVQNDPRMQKLREALRIVMNESGNRAELVQMLFSDKTPPPAK